MKIEEMFRMGRDKKTTDEPPNKGTVFVSGYAMLPGKIPAYSMFGTVGVFLIIDSSHGKIIDADFSLVSRTAKEILQSIFVGKNIDNDRELILEELDLRYFGHAQKALVAATNNLLERYDEMTHKENE